MPNDNATEKPKLKITASNAYLALRDFRVPKKSKKTRVQPGTRTRTSKLALLPTLPLDILLEIFSNLLPLDVLHLSRASKALRRVLMHRSSMSVWKSAFASIPDLPPCPDDSSSLSETITSRLLPYEDVVIKNPDSDLASVFKKCLIFITWRDWPGTWCLKKDRDSIAHELQIWSSDRKDFLWLKTREANARRESSLMCSLWAHTKQTQRYDELDELREQRFKDICRRLIDIGFGEEVTYIRNLRYGDHFLGKSTLKVFVNLPAVRRPQALTEQIWKNIQPALLNYMAQAKAHRIENELAALNLERFKMFAEAWTTFRQSLPPSMLLPSPFDIRGMDGISDILNKSPSDPEHPSTDTQVSVALFEPALNALMPFIDKWRTDVAILGARKVLNFHGPLPYLFEYFCPETRLRLATTVFYCNAPWHTRMTETILPEPTYHRMYWPEFMYHQCNSSRWYDYTGSFLERDETLGSGEWIGCQRCAWSATHLDVDVGASDMAAKIVAACGRDSDEATVEELDALDPRLVCLKCTRGARCDGERIMPIRSWRQTVDHAMDVHWGASDVDFECITEEDTVLARSAQDMEPEARRWRCFRCVDTQKDVLMTTGQLSNHLRAHHFLSMKRAVQGKDYFLAPEVRPRQPLTLKMKPKKVTAAPCIKIRGLLGKASD
ncbi:hypothetical protein FISHEDRAFT_70186 [Fistulina hepatica ATCC 64428]|uniref:F-box domain-containing protein n=1 Tax=Fistulina hepatica ATCC 64428 TaxID=1128425 RepID=A0A0D7AJB3_9AGAR|nr:hypothetical protein FISHEDRAFT_70186 [Fistulina hepatica ATCC 64428]